MSNIIPFNFQNHEIRIIQDKNGEPLFVAKDVAIALGYEKPRNAISTHCKGALKQGPLQTSGGLQKVRVIQEPDLYRLVIGSKLPEAQKFEKLVFEEILPSIRRTGKYAIENRTRVIHCEYYTGPVIRVIEEDNEFFFVIKDLIKAFKNTDLAEKIKDCNQYSEPYVIKDRLERMITVDVIKKVDVDQLMFNFNTKASSSFNGYFDGLEERHLIAHEKPQYSPKQIRDANNLFKSNLKIAKLVLKGDAALLSANEMTYLTTRIRVLENIGVSSLSLAKN